MLVSYACHSITLGPNNLLARVDYPEYIVRTLDAAYPDAMVLAATGCSGQINTGHSCRHRGLAWRTYGEAKRLGRAGAGAAM